MSPCSFLGRTPSDAHFSRETAAGAYSRGLQAPDGRVWQCGGYDDVRWERLQRNRFAHWCFRPAKAWHEHDALGGGGTWFATADVLPAAKCECSCMPPVESVLTASGHLDHQDTFAGNVCCRQALLAKLCCVENRWQGWLCSRV